MCIFRRCLSSRPSAVSGSVHWSIQSWPSRKAVAIGCIRPTCSGVADECQLPPLSPSPKTRCRGDRSIFLLQRCCLRCAGLLSLKQGFSRSFGAESTSIGSQEASCPRTTRRRRRRLSSSVSVLCTRADATRLSSKTETRLSHLLVPFSSTRLQSRLTPLGLRRRAVVRGTLRFQSHLA